MKSELYHASSRHPPPRIKNESSSGQFGGSVKALDAPEPAPYAAILERQARRCPYNWFNFYDFWSA